MPIAVSGAESLIDLAINTDPIALYPENFTDVPAKGGVSLAGAESVIEFVLPTAPGNDPTFGPAIGYDPSFTATQLDPLRDPLLYRFAANEPTLEVIHDWDPGAGKIFLDAGAGLVYKFPAFGTYTVVHTITFGESTLISSEELTVADTRIKANEDVNDVLNQRRGYFSYEPIFTTGGQVVDKDDAVISFGSEAIAPGNTSDVLVFTASEDISVNSIPVSGDCDCIVRIYKNDSQILPRIRIHNDERQGNALPTGTIVLSKDDEIRIEVEAVATRSTTAANFEVAIVGRKA